jgi:cell growth-regulating nucleolar protein
VSEASLPIVEPITAPAPAIHPSRLNQLGSDTPEPSYGAGFGGSRGGRFGRGGRGGRAPQPQREGYARYSATGENNLAPQGGMRSWGSAPTSEADFEASTSSAAMAPAGTEDKKIKKKKKKGDKKGTGSRANTRNPPRIEDEAESAESAGAQISAPSSGEKRKRSPSPPADSQSSPLPLGEKTLKRLRKNMSKLGEKSPSIPLAEWLEKVGKNKDKEGLEKEVLQGVQVSWVEGRWQLSV